MLDLPFFEQGPLKMGPLTLKFELHNHSEVSRYKKTAEFLSRFVKVIIDSFTDSQESIVSFTDTVEGRYETKL